MSGDVEEVGCGCACLMKGSKTQRAEHCEGYRRQLHDILFAIYSDIKSIGIERVGINLMDANAYGPLSPENANTFL